ncbi:hypothetical protein [Pseudonocardia acidicola]|uniref:Uncharacterized protein n=1 Tax=Pseudonocardia acidicola TaxID=2724939 RepID=A0ABX1SBN6_9PSEU|nr:hypothetical protein [Pseudonocardia acidicola]NMH98227.1 hypothetical protein [Pseudonocardia acidicola]
MRPTPSETIAGIRAILKDVVEPEVGSEYARSRLREIRAVLAQIDWNDAWAHVRRRDREIRGLLTEVREWIEADPERADRFADLAARIGAARDGSAQDDSAETFAELNACHDADAALLVEAGEALARWGRDHPDAGPEESGRELRMHILQRLGS